MTTVTLQRMWLTSVVTGETLGWYTAPDREQSYSTRGEIRFYAGGIPQAVGSVGVAGDWKFQLLELTLADTAVLRRWLDAGVLLLARDYRGQTMYGTFFQLDLGENKALTWDSPQNTYMATVVLQQVDVVEGV